jgi:hypothetical protein
MVPCYVTISNGSQIRILLTCTLSPKCFLVAKIENRLCGLVARVPGYRSRGPSVHSLRYQIF